MGRSLLNETAGASVSWKNWSNFESDSLTLKSSTGCRSNLRLPWLLPIIAGLIDPRRRLRPPKRLLLRSADRFTSPVRGSTRLVVCRDWSKSRYEWLCCDEDMIAYLFIVFFSQIAKINRNASRSNSDNAKMRTNMTMTMGNVTTIRSVYKTTNKTEIITTEESRKRHMPSLAIHFTIQARV